MYQIFFGFALLLFTMFLPIFSVSIPYTERIIVMCVAVMLISRGLDIMHYFNQFLSFFDDDLEVVNLDDKNNEDGDK